MQFADAFEEDVEHISNKLLSFPTDPAQIEAPSCPGYTMEVTFMFFSNIEDAVIMLCTDALKMNNTLEETGNH